MPNNTMYTQNITLDINTNIAYSVVSAKQGDNLTRTININLVENGMPYCIGEGHVLYFRMRKPDGHAVVNRIDDNDISTSEATGTCITYTLTDQCLAVAGRAYADIVETATEVDITSASEVQILSTVSFIVNIMSRPNVTMQIESTDEFERVIYYNEHAEQIINTAEAYGAGTRDGSAVQPGDPAYENNAKYYSDLANEAALNNHTDKLAAEGYAVGTQDGIPVSEGTYYQNNAKYYKEQAENSASAASSSETNALDAKNIAVNAKNDAVSAKNDAIDAKTAAQTAQASAESALQTLTSASATATSLNPNQSATASYSEGVFSFGIPQGIKGDTGNPGQSPTISTSKVGSVTTVTIEDIEGTKTFQVLDGTGSGDMTTNVYDPAGGSKQVAFSADLATVATTGSYNDLIDQPPVGNAVTVGETSPVSPNEGDIWVDTTANPISDYATVDYVNNKTAIYTQAEQPVGWKSGDIWIDTSTNLAKYRDETNTVTIKSEDELPSQSNNSGKFLSTDGTSASWDDIYETSLQFGGESLSNEVSVYDAAASNYLNPNRFQFAQPAGITIEYSTDNGSTWVDYGATDAEKIGLVSGIDQHFVVGKKTASEDVVTLNDKLRITFDASNMGVYLKLSKILINAATMGVSGSQTTVEVLFFNDEDNYVEIGTYRIAGWPAWNSIPIVHEFGRYNGDQSNHWKKIRFTFFMGTLSSDFDNKFNIKKIVALGPFAWVHPSNMANHGHIYNWDASQNVTFPSNVNVTGTLSENNSRVLTQATGAASRTQAGIVNTTSQTFGGTKNFYNEATFIGKNNNGAIRIQSLTNESTDKSVLLRNDGTGFYMLVSDNGTGTFNSLRPFVMNLSDGSVHCYNNFTANSIAISGEIYRQGKSIIDLIYPVGAVYISVNSTSPATLFGGTWEQISGRFLLACDSTYTAGSVGGEATHVLTTNEMPSHRHGIRGDLSGAGGQPLGGRPVVIDNACMNWDCYNGDDYPTMLNTGGDQAHNNMPPYLSVYMWKRTA